MTEENRAKKNDKWAIVGKIGATGVVIVTIVGGIIGISNYFYQKEEKLSATGVYSKFQLPEKFRNELFRYKEPSSTEIRNIIENSIQKDAKEKYIDYFEPTQKIVDYLRNYEKPKNDMLESVQRLNSFIEIEIQNKGLKQADNVTLEINGNGFYQIKDSKPDTLNEFTNSIPLGSLRPSVKMQVYIWNNSSFSSSDKSLVTYTNGVEPIVFNQDKQEIPFSIFNYFPHAIFLLIFTILVFLFGAKFQENLQNKENEKGEKAASAKGSKKEQLPETQVKELQDSPTENITDAKKPLDKER